MERTATFTITRHEKTTGWYYTLKCKAYNQYNKYDVHEKLLYEAMEELADTFNNVLGVGILFGVE